MADTVIYPLSEETGIEILRALRRIAVALEGGSGGSGDTATYSGGELEISNATYDGGTLTTTATYDNGELTF